MLLTRARLDGVGSSPRVRGTRVAQQDELHVLRFIPARAGNASLVCPARITPAVHPRACGERMSGAHTNRRDRGSSPRVRGTRYFCQCASGQNRFIPARAGNARGRRSFLGCASVHPRACGERVSAPKRKISTSGSSPRVRGTHVLPMLCFQITRFIPARAGNASRSSTSSIDRTVHPRACGERLFTADPMGCDCGSSPRVRGTHPGHVCISVPLRFIPARAGNATPYEAPYVPETVHPRACGERTYAGAVRQHWIGSSPRVRGTHSFCNASTITHRFIPARAGNARSSS